jgi:hypothetical protein
MGAPIISYPGHHIPVCRVDAADTYGRVGANPRVALPCNHPRQTRLALTLVARPTFSSIHIPM